MPPHQNEWVWHQSTTPKHMCFSTYDEKFAVQSILSSAYIIGMKGAGGARSAGRWGDRWVFCMERGLGNVERGLLSC